MLSTQTKLLLLLLPLLLSLNYEQALGVCVQAQMQPPMPARA